ncbi:MAG TPA: metalloregulator ArsR/SmtB family transcription factor [Polyangiaceae bacterium]|jgi:DNA-binding transcriptional ArsR family regulator
MPKKSESESESSPPPECPADEHARRQPRARPSDEAFVRAAALFRAAGEITRLRLLARLSEGEWCVTELAEAAGVSLTSVSQQLSVLRSQRIVGHRRAGKHIYYSLLDEHVIEMIQNALEHASEER